MLVLMRRVSRAEVDHVLDRLRRRLPHLFAGVDRDTRIDSVLVDSLDLVELLCAIEEEFGVRLSQNTFANAKTVADLAKAVARRSLQSGKVDHALR